MAQIIAWKARCWVTHTQTHYCNPRCACAPRVNKKQADLNSEKKPHVFQFSLLHAYAARMQTSRYILSYVRTAQSLARVQYIVLFDLKPLNEDSNLQVYVYTVCMHKKEHQKPPEHTSEHVKPQNFLGACPKTTLAQFILWPPLLYLPWAPFILSTALCMFDYEWKCKTMCTCTILIVNLPAE